MLTNSLTTMTGSPRIRVQRLASGCVTERGVGARATVRARHIARERGRDAACQRKSD